MATKPDTFPRGGGLPRDDAARGTDRRSDRDRLYLIRHLAVAAERLADDRPEDARRARWIAVTARLRDIAAGASRPALGPTVPIPGRPGAPLVDLLAVAWERHRGMLPDRGFDGELVEAARQLLSDLHWSLPDDVRRPLFGEVPRGG